MTTLNLHCTLLHLSVPSTDGDFDQKKKKKKNFLLSSETFELTYTITVLIEGNNPRRVVNFSGEVYDVQLTHNKTNQ